MSITALDLGQKTFRRTLRGYDRREVDALLQQVAGELAERARELQELRDELARRDDQLATSRAGERLLQETLVSAQQACDQLRQDARRDADLTVSEAQLKAERIVQGAHRRYVRLMEDVHEAKRQRVQFAAGVRSLVEAHLKLLEAFDDGAEVSVEYLGEPRSGAEEKKGA